MSAASWGGMARGTAGFYDRWDRGKVASLLERFDIDPEQQVKPLGGSNQVRYFQIASFFAGGWSPAASALDRSFSPSGTRGKNSTCISFG